MLPDFLRRTTDSDSVAGRPRARTRPVFVVLGVPVAIFYVFVLLMMLSMPVRKHQLSRIEALVAAAVAGDDAAKAEAIEIVESGAEFDATRTLAAMSQDAARATMFRSTARSLVRDHGHRQAYAYRTQQAMHLLHNVSQSGGDERNLAKYVLQRALNDGGNWRNLCSIAVDILLCYDNLDKESIRLLDLAAAEPHSCVDLSARERLEAIPRGQEQQ